MRGPPHEIDTGKNRTGKEEKNYNASSDKLSAERIGGVNNAGLCSISFMAEAACNLQVTNLRRTQT